MVSYSVKVKSLVDLCCILPLENAKDEMKEKREFPSVYCEDSTVGQST